MVSEGSNDQRARCAGSAAATRAPPALHACTAAPARGRWTHGRQTMRHSEWLPHCQPPASNRARLRVRLPQRPVAAHIGPLKAALLAALPARRQRGEVGVLCGGRQAGRERWCEGAPMHAARGAGARAGSRTQGSAVRARVGRDIARTPRYRSNCSKLTSTQQRAGSQRGLAAQPRTEAAPSRPAGRAMEPLLLPLAGRRLLKSASVCTDRLLRAPSMFCSRQQAGQGGGGRPR